MSECGVPRRRILCVESHEDTRSLLSLMLEQTGYEVMTAASVTEGLDLARNSCFDLYLLDTWWFTDGTGVELCKLIRDFDPNTPVLFYSAEGVESNRRRAMEAGGQAYVVKPDNTMLEKTLARLIEQSDGNNLEAKQAAFKAAREELDAQRSRSRSGGEQLSTAEQWNLRIKACQAFMTAGGIRANFERIWPALIETLTSPEKNPNPCTVS